MPDTIFKDALIIDGSGSEPFLSDLRIAGERIAEIGKISAAPEDTVIRFMNCALCPGFVDAHGHSDYHLLVLPAADSKLLQGMTTEIGGNCGFSAAPVFGELTEERKKNLQEEYRLDLKISTMKEYYSQLRATGLGVNFAPLIGYNTVRACVIGYRKETPSPQEMTIIQAEIVKAMEQGCFGMSAGLIYAPGSFATVDELVEALAPVREAGGIFTCHIRSESDELVEAVSEFIEIGRRAKVRLELSHLKTAGRQNWPKLGQVFELVENARNEGVDIMADRYPYTASFTGLSSVLPDWVFEGTGSAYQQRIMAEREAVKQELEKRTPESWRRIVVSQCFSGKAKEYEGKNIAELAEREKKDPSDFVIDFLASEKIGPNAIIHSMSEENMDRIYQKDWVMVGSDSEARAFEGVLAKGKPHPRGFGTFPRFIAQFARNKNMFSLSKAIEKSSRVCAEHFRIKDRGKIAVGYFADLVLFDPEIIRDQATFENPFIPPAGIEMVVVNGQIAVMSGELTGRLAGRPLEMGR